MYYLTVYQPEDWPVIEIEIRRNKNRGSAHISARKSLGADGKLAPAVVAPNVAFRSEYTPDEALEVAEWWQVAATAAESLEAMVKTREDLSRPIKARLVGKTVTLEFVPVEE